MAFQVFCVRVIVKLHLWSINQTYIFTQEVEYWYGPLKVPDFRQIEKNALYVNFTMYIFGFFLIAQYNPLISPPQSKTIQIITIIKKINT